MAKTATTTTKKTAAKTPRAPKVEMTFGEWIKTVARSRNDVGGEFVKAAKADKKFPDYKELPRFTKKFGNDAGFLAAKARYEQFVNRGSQAQAQKAA